MVVAHRPGVLAAVDRLAVIGNGQLTGIRPPVMSVLRKVVRPQAGGPGPAASGGGPQAVAVTAPATA